MAVFGITLFNRYNKWGWTYGWTKTEPGEDPGQINLGPIFGLAWQAVHNNYVVLEGVRVVNLEKPRMALSKSLMLFGTAGATPAYPGFSVKMLLTGAGGASRFLQLRGLPSGWLAIDGPTGLHNLPGVATTAINNFGQQFIDDHYEIRKLIGTITNPNRAITGIRNSTEVPGYLSFWTTPDLGLSTGDRVLIGRADHCQFPGLNGEWEIIDDTADFYTIKYKWREAELLIVTPDGAVARLADYGQHLITGRAIYSVGTRDTGRPSKLSRGRSQGVSCRQ